MPLQQFDERNIYSWQFAFDVGATPGVYVDVSGSWGSDVRVDTIQVSNSDTIDHNIALAYLNGNDSSVLVEAKIPAGSGYGVLPLIDMLAPLMPAAYHYVLQLNGSRFYMTVREAVGAGTYVIANGQGGSF
jgi:pantoate kinase